MDLFKPKVNTLEKAINKVSEEAAAKTEGGEEVDLGAPAAPAIGKFGMPPGAPKSIDGFTRPANPVNLTPPAPEPELNSNQNEGEENMNQDNAVEAIINDVASRQNPEAEAAPAEAPAAPVNPAEAAAPVMPPAMEAAEPAAEPALNVPDLTAPETAAPAGDLARVKTSALAALAPLMDKIDLPPEKQFDIYAEVIDANKDKTLVEKALAAAQGIADEKVKAEDLLKLVQMIDTL